MTKKELHQINSNKHIDGEKSFIEFMVEHLNIEYYFSEIYKNDK